MSTYYICFKLQKAKPVTNPQRKQSVFKQKGASTFSTRSLVLTYQIILKIPFQRLGYPQFKALRFDPQHASKQPSTHTNMCLQSQQLGRVEAGDSLKSRN